MAGPPAAPLCGVLNLDKPRGCTSRDLVNFVQRFFPRKTKVGHCGALDPLATGVLPICVGKATRLVPYLMDGAKAYTVRSRLDIRTDTQDMEGEITATYEPWSPPEAKAVSEAAARFVGSIEQTVPAYSAVRVGGRRLYDMARKNELPDTLPVRTVKIDSIHITGYDYPYVDWEVACGKGTYVRQIAQDMGAVLDLGGTVVSLTRTRVGSLTLPSAASAFEVFTRSVVDELAGLFIPWRGLFPAFGWAVVRPSGVERLRRGSSLGEEHILRQEETSAEEILLLDGDDGLLALARRGRTKRAVIEPIRVLIV